MEKNIAKVLFENGFTESLSMSRRVVFIGAVKVNGEPVTDITHDVDLSEGATVSCGKTERVIPKR